jgi:hypothetical protein
MTLEGKRLVYDGLKESMPEVVENLKAMVALGKDNPTIISIIYIHTPCNVPREVWQAIDISLDVIRAEQLAVSR